MLLESRDKFKYQISLKYSDRLLKIVFDRIGCVRPGRSIRVSKFWIFFRNYRPNDSPLQTYSIGSRISTVNCQLSTINCQLP
ncbi:MAG: hypothetical protein HC942_05785 [Microcoleus sp. SU_5_6]|nr:hypothetical protein [Microcoleus sp. SU_5_6]